MLTRRDSLRLALLALVGPPVLAACGGDGDNDGGGRMTVDSDVDLLSSERGRAPGRPEAIPDVVAAMHGFAGGVYDGLAATPGNLVLSPYSIAVALGMTLAGAAGRTATEMRDVLGVDDDARFHGGLNALTSYVEDLAGEQERMDGSKAEVALDGANQLFGQRGVGWERRFLDLLAEEYGAGMRLVDYETAAEDARQLINRWVAGRTQDRITDLIAPGVLDAMSRLVLVNAIYLKAPWEHPFDTSLTAMAPFHLADGGTVDVETMRSSEVRGSVARGSGWRAARIPYAGGRLAMTVVLPDPGRTGDVERLVAGGDLGDLLAGGRPTVLDLELPKWTFRTNAPLGDRLVELGMPTAFDRTRADFRPMTEEDLDLYISAVVHEGFIAVDEEGTEAAAATAVVMTEASAPVAQPFHVDRPFLFVIHDVEHGTPLFLGRVDDPSA